MTIPDRDAIMTISAKSKIEFVGIWKTRIGDKKMNWETMERAINSPANIVIDKTRYFLYEKTILNVSLYIA